MQSVCSASIRIKGGMSSTDVIQNMQTVRSVSIWIFKLGGFDKCNPTYSFVASQEEYPKRTNSILNTKSYDGTKLFDKGEFYKKSSDSIKHNKIFLKVIVNTCKY